MKLVVFFFFRMPFWRSLFLKFKKGECLALPETDAMDTALCSDQEVVSTYSGFAAPPLF